MIDSHENMRDGPTFTQEKRKEKKKKKRVIPVHRIIHGFPLNPLSESVIAM